MKVFTINNEAINYQLKQSLNNIFSPTCRIKLCSRYKKQENRLLMKSKNRYRLFPFFSARHKQTGIESEQLYHTLFMNATMPLWITDRKSLKILEVNQAAADFYGYERENLLGKTAFDIMDHIDVALLDGSSKQAANNHLVIRAGYISRAVSYVWIDLIINNVYFKEREVYLICHVLI